ncbi:MAG: hypothetical protein JXX28_12255 [Deltaproteobacteria bacterium]|nr:hypothetical protein [Deltaproteobacteria bacterium]
MSSERQADQLARWLEGAPGSQPEDALDQDVLEAIYALRPERAPAARVTVDDILAGVTEGPFAAAAPSAAASAPAEANGEVIPLRRWWPALGGLAAGGLTLGGLAAAALVALTVGPALLSAPEAEQAAVRAGSHDGVAALEDTAASERARRPRAAATQPTTAGSGPSDLSTRGGAGPAVASNNQGATGQIADLDQRLAASPTPLAQAPSAVTSSIAVAEAPSAAPAGRPGPYRPIAEAAEIYPAVAEAEIFADLEAEDEPTDYDADDAFGGGGAASGGSAGLGAAAVDAVSSPPMRDEPAAPFEGAATGGSWYQGKEDAAPEAATLPSSAPKRTGRDSRREESSGAARALSAEEPSPAPTAAAHPTEDASSIELPAVRASAVPRDLSLVSPTILGGEAAIAAQARIDRSDTLASLGDPLGAAGVRSANIIQPAVFGQSEAIQVVRWYAQAGALSEARRAARDGLALGSGNTPQLSGLLVAYGDALLLGGDQATALEVWRKAAALNSAR